jgi:hypothetical protein
MHHPILSLGVILPDSPPNSPCIGNVLRHALLVLPG